MENNTNYHSCFMLANCLLFDFGWMSDKVETKLRRFQKSGQTQKCEISQLSIFNRNI